MKQSTVDNIKVNVLAEKIKEAIKNGTLEQKMNIFRIEASGLGLNDELLNKLISEARDRTANDKDTLSFMQKYKKSILIVFAAFIIIELFLPIGWGWKLFIILLTVILGIILLSVTIVKHRKQAL